MNPDTCGFAELLLIKSKGTLLERAGANVEWLKEMKVFKGIEYEFCFPFVYFSPQYAFCVT